MTLFRRLLLGGAVALVPAVASAQGVEAVGMRALGMGGAFVAVADDATATYWNPAGLVTGSVFSAVAEVSRGDVEGAPLGGPDPTAFNFSGQGSTLVALGTWPVGMTFYRLSDATARVVGRDDPVAGLTRLTTTHVGLNLLHSLAQGLHVGATLKYVHGSAGQELRAPAPGDPLGAARDIATRGSSRFDVDAGLMVDLRKVKLGLTGRNLLEPEFDTAEVIGRLQLPRQVRAGAAFRAAETLMVSVDADLTRTPDITGDWRSLAAGVEQQLWQNRAAVRGGVRVSTAGDARPIVTSGGSIALKSGIYADGYVAIGLEKAAQDGFGVGVRVVF